MKNSLRPLRLTDWRFARELASEPSVRGPSFDQRLPTRWGHARWMLRWIFKRDRKAWVIESDLANDGGRFTVPRRTGLVRVTSEPSRSIISIALMPQHRGYGLGTWAIRRATALAIEAWGILVLAEIKPDNVASIRAFTSAGYEWVDGGDAMRYAP